MTECLVLNCAQELDGFHDLQEHLEDDHGQLVPTPLVMGWAEKQERELRKEVKG